MLVKLLQKKSYWERKKNEYSSQYQTWVSNLWLNFFACIGALDVIKRHLIETNYELIKVCGWFIFALCLLAGFYSILKFLNTLVLAKKIDKCWQKMVLIDKEIATYIMQLKEYQKK